MDTQQQKRDSRITGIPLNMWLGDEGSNLDKRSQSPAYTIENQYAFTCNSNENSVLASVELLSAVVHCRLFFAPSALKMH